MPKTANLVLNRVMKLTYFVLLLVLACSVPVDLTSRKPVLLQDDKTPAELITSSDDPDAQQKAVIESEQTTIKGDDEGEIKKSSLALTTSKDFDQFAADGEMAGLVEDAEDADVAGYKKLTEFTPNKSKELSKPSGGD
jgi:hypothetical protein